MTRPAMMPRAIVSVRDSVSPRSPPMVTPAEKNAKTGTATRVGYWFPPVGEVGGETLIHRVTLGCGADLDPGPCGGRTGTVNPSSTPATVACTPEA